MAKKIQVSDDAGTNWYTLPGSTGTMDLNGDEIDDTILGQTFKSSEAGLINWDIVGEALYKGFAGYQAKLKQQGTSTTMTTESMSLVSGKTYSIDAASKEIWDRSATLTVFDNAVDHTADVIDINYLYGQVTFASSYTVTGPITVSGKYFPTVTFANAQSFTLTQTMNPIDNTTFAKAQTNGGFKEFEAGLRTVQLSLSGVFDASTGMTAVLTGRGEVVIEIDPAGDGTSIARGFFRILKKGQQGDVGALEEESVTASLNVPADDLISKVFAWRHGATTTIPTALKKILTAWEDETSLTARYMPTGVVGASPKDAIEGTIWLSDVSLSSGLSAMNKFNASLQGSGAVTEV